MFRKPFSIHFKTVLLVWMVLILFLYMIINGIISAREMVNEISVSIYNDNVLITEVISDKINELFRRPNDELTLISELLARDSDVAQSFELGIQVTSHMRSFDRIILVDKNDKVVEVWPYNSYILGMDQSGTGYRKTLQNDPAVFWSGTYVNYTSGEISLDLVVPIGEQYLVGTIYLEELSSLMTMLKNKPGAIIAITDRNKTYLAHTDPENVRQRVYDPFLRALDSVGEKDEITEIVVEGVRMRPFAAPLSIYGWNVVIYQPAAIYERPIWSLLAKIFFVQLITVSVLVVLLVIGSNYMNRIVKGILQYIHQIEEGDYDVRAPKAFLIELQTVLMSFEQMTDKIKLREHEVTEKSVLIQKMNENLEVKIKERTIDLELANQNLKHTMQSLIDTQERLIQQEKMSSLGQLVEGVAHEINTPLGIGITTASFIEYEVDALHHQMLQDEMSNEGLDAFLMTMKESSMILNQVLQRTAQLVDHFKQIAVEQKSFSMVEVSVAEILQSVFAELGLAYEDPRFSIRFSQHDIRILCFPEDFVLIFFNLLRNAMLHGIGNMENGKIQVLISRMGNDLELKIIDNGRGIPKAYLNRVFDPFFTTQRGSSEVSGRGLGLYIVYNTINKRYNGKITCDSDDNGTVFQIEIPGCVVSHQGELL